MSCRAALFSEIYVRIYQLWQNGDKAAAQELHKQLLPWIQRWMTHCEYIIQVEKRSSNAEGSLPAIIAATPDGH